jgi:hypothetical protein
MVREPEDLLSGFSLLKTVALSSHSRRAFVGDAC